MKEIKTAEELKTSAEWQAQSLYEVINPDGWDRRNYTYSWNEEKITETEFFSRMSVSTVRRKPHLNDIP